MKKPARLLALVMAALCAAACGHNEREPDLNQAPAVDSGGEEAGHQDAPAVEPAESDPAAGPAEGIEPQGEAAMDPAGEAGADVGDPPAVDIEGPAMFTGPVTIACVGDSITWGDGVKVSRSTDSYPAQLQALFDAAGGQAASSAQVTVLNFGRNGRTLQSAYERAYTLCDEYGESLESGADVYLILLGSNDAAPEYWDREGFQRDVASLYDTYLALETASGEKPAVIALLPPCVFPFGGDPNPFGIERENLESGVIPAVRAAAEARGLPVIDLFELTRNRPEWFADGVHPNAEGNAAIAVYIFEELSRGRLF